MATELPSTAEEWQAWIEEQYATMLAEARQFRDEAAKVYAAIETMARPCIGFGSRLTTDLQAILAAAATNEQTARVGHFNIRDRKDRGYDYWVDQHGRAGIALSNLVNVNLPAMQARLANEGCATAPPFVIADSTAILLDLAQQPFSAVEQTIQQNVAAGPPPSDDEVFAADLVQVFKAAVPGVQAALQEYLDEQYRLIADGRNAAVMLAKQQLGTVGPAAWRFEEVLTPPTSHNAAAWQAALLSLAEYEEGASLTDPDTWRYLLADVPPQVAEGAEAGREALVLLRTVLGRAVPVTSLAAEYTTYFDTLQALYDRWERGRAAYQEVIEFFEGKDTGLWGGNAEESVRATAAANPGIPELAELAQPWGQAVFDAFLEGKVYQDPRVGPPAGWPDSTPTPQPTVTVRQKSGGSLLPALLLGAGGFVVAGPVGAVVGFGAGAALGSK